MKPALLFAMSCLCLVAQQSAQFEVASIRRVPPNSLITMIGVSPSGSRLTIKAMSLANLISWAYGMKPWQVTGGPPWAGSQSDSAADTSRFDITCKAEGDAARSTDEFRQMLQSLLADRFQLTVHRVLREVPVYALVVDRNGPKFRESGPDSEHMLRMNGGGKIFASGASMTMLVDQFSNANGSDRPVIDATGLTGRYDFTLEYSNTRPGAPPDSTLPSVFTAMQEQLGLKLEPRRGSIEFISIDHAEPPSEN